MTMRKASQGHNEKLEAAGLGGFDVFLFLFLILRLILKLILPRVPSAGWRLPRHPLAQFLKRWGFRVDPLGSCGPATRSRKEWEDPSHCCLASWELKTIDA